MYTYSDLKIEIEKEIEELLDEHEPVLHPDWITKAILNRHHKISGQDADFFAYNAREHVRNEVRRVLNRYKLKPEIEADRQLVLPGFARLQQYYLVARDSEQVAVRVDLLSREEVRAKYAELLAMAMGLMKHVEEFERYFLAKGYELAA
jgi:hypothetical protein